MIRARALGGTLIVGNLDILKLCYFVVPVKEPACDTLMHETTNALMMMGLFSHELRSLAKMVS